MITYIGSTTSGTMPGSPTDFTFIGNSGAFSGVNSPGDTTPGTTNLADFTESVGSGDSGVYSVMSQYAVISAPVGYTGSGTTPLQTAVAYGGALSGTTTDLVNFTLGSSPSFSYSDFYVYVMYSNYNSTVHSDADLDLTLGSKALVQPVTDVDLHSLSEAQFALFHVTGGSSGDLLEIGATSTTDNALIGGVSFIQSVPEPSTYAMLLAGLAFLGLRFRRRIS